jgi:uncharacterized protein
MVSNDATLVPGRGKPSCVHRVPMSVATTLGEQRSRLDRLGLRVHEQPPLRDVDTIEDARAVAREAPWSRFASGVAATAWRRR